MIYRDPKLLKACREISCQNCGKFDGTVCAAHSNSSKHGKGMGLKASDACVAALCYRCHTALDNGSELNRAQRIELWEQAHMKTMRTLIELGILEVK